MPDERRKGKDMGQYFTAALKKNSQIVVLKNFGSLRLMGHSYVGNPYVNQIVKALRICAGAQVAWIGDYALDESLDSKGPYFLDSVFGNNKKKLEDVTQMAKAVNRNKNVISIDLEIGDSEQLQDHFLLNTDRKEFIHVRKIGDLVIHPLPILTCSNPGSGGNYAPHEGEDDEKYFCSWCGDNIVFSECAPPIAEGWTEIPQDIFHEGGNR